MYLPLCLCAIVCCYVAHHLFAGMIIGKIMDGRGLWLMTWFGRKADGRHKKVALIVAMAVE